jgi:hypothetical protein
MTVIKAFDEDVQAWQTVVVGKQGPQGDPAVVDADLPITYDAGTQTVGTDGSLLVTVAHGTANAEPRPTFAATVYWKGEVAPDNGADGDLWFDTGSV